MALTKEENQTLMTSAFTVSSPCGRAWEVPMRKVLNDYVAYRKQADGHTRAQVLVDISMDDISSWFYEQYTWDDVERDGRLVATPTLAQINQALDHMRTGSSPAEVSELGPSSHEHSRVRRVQLRNVVQAPASKDKPKPRM